MPKQNFQDDALGEIPPDHPWFKAVVQLVNQLANEDWPGLIAPPKQSTHDDRTYDAGRVSMAQDILRHLRSRHEANSDG